MVSGRWGSEPDDGDDGRFRLSFTVGGLLAGEGRLVAAMVADDMDAGDDAHATAQPDPDGELGERAARVRQRAVDGNVLAIRTRAAGARTVSEVLKRLSALTGAELRHLAAPDSSADDCRALMWVAMCRYYAVVGQFAAEVLRDRYLMGMTTVGHDDYDRFIRSKAMWHPELEGLSPSTAAKLRSNLFKAMAEAGLLERHGADGRTLLPALLGPAVTAILAGRPESFRYFPMRTPMLPRTGADGDR